MKVLAQEFLRSFRDACCRCRAAACIAPVPAIMLALALATTAAQAEDRTTAVVSNPSYQEECAACHIAYPAAMLPADSWRRLMSSLAQHFGSDASLDAKTAGTLTAWLTANAASGPRAREGTTADRITQTPWFKHEHEEVGAAVWRRVSVRSAANCAACHAGAAQGNFSDDDVHIPN